jgi:hypothetical protein
MTSSAIFNQSVQDIKRHLEPTSRNLELAQASIARITTPKMHHTFPRILPQYRDLTCKEIESLGLGLYESEFMKINPDGTTLILGTKSVGSEASYKTLKRRQSMIR